MSNPNLPLAQLIGVVSNANHGNCALVFEMATPDGQRLSLPYGKVMEALKFAQQQGVMPPLSAHWWARIGETHGCAL